MAKMGSVGRKAWGLLVVCVVAGLLVGCEEAKDEQSGSGRDLPRYIGQGGQITFTFESGTGAAVVGFQVTYQTTFDQPANGWNTKHPETRYNPTSWYWSGYTASEDHGTLTLNYSGGRQEVYEIYTRTFRYTGTSNGAVLGTATGTWREGAPD